MSELTFTMDEMANETRTYRLDPAALPAEEKRMMTKQAPGLLAAYALMIGVAVFMSIHNEADPRLIVFTVLFAGLFMTYLAFSSIRRLRRCIRETWASYELAIDDHELRCKANIQAETTIAFNEITRVDDVDNRWLTVHGTKHGQRIGIPKSLIGYEDVHARLSSLIQPQERKRHLWQKPAALFLMTLLAWFAMTYSTNRVVVGVLSATMTIWLVWCVVYVRRSPFVTPQTKRSIWFVFLPTIACAARFLWALGLMG